MYSLLSIFGQNYPNPFDESTVIPYNLPKNQGIIKIVSLNGKVMQETIVTNTDNSLDVDTTDWDNGVYYYSIHMDGQKTETRRMILIK